MEVLQFIFRGPFTFLGICILLIIVFDGIAGMIKAARKPKAARPAPAGSEESEAR